MLLLFPSRFPTTLHLSSDITSSVLDGCFSVLFLCSFIPFMRHWNSFNTMCFIQLISIEINWFIINCASSAFALKSLIDIFMTKSFRFSTFVLLCYCSWWPRGHWESSRCILTMYLATILLQFEQILIINKCLIWANI